MDLDEGAGPGEGESGAGLASSTEEGIGLDAEVNRVGDRIGDRTGVMGWLGDGAGAAVDDEAVYVLSIS